MMADHRSVFSGMQLFLTFRFVELLTESQPAHNVNSFGQGFRLAIVEVGIGHLHVTQGWHLELKNDRRPCQLRR